MKLRNKKKILKIITLNFFLFFLCVSISQATEINFVPQVGIPNTEFNTTFTFKGDSGAYYIAKFVQAIYEYGVSVVAILAAIMLMAGGLVWLSSGGNQEKVGKAKNIIFGSLIGMFLLIGAHTILKTINPNLVNLRIPDIKNIDPPEYGCCVIKKTDKSIIANFAKINDLYWNSNYISGMVSAETCYKLHKITEEKTAAVKYDSSSKKTLAEYLGTSYIKGTSELIFRKNAIAIPGTCSAKALGVIGISKIAENGTQKVIIAPLRSKQITKEINNSLGSHKDDGFGVASFPLTVSWMSISGEKDINQLFDSALRLLSSCENKKNDCKVYTINRTSLLPSDLYYDFDIFLSENNSHTPPFQNDSSVCVCENGVPKVKHNSDIVNEIFNEAFKSTVGAFYQK